MTAEALSPAVNWRIIALCAYYGVQIVEYKNIEFGTKTAHETYQIINCNPKFKNHAGMDSEAGGNPKPPAWAWAEMYNISFVLLSFFLSTSSPE